MLESLGVDSDEEQVYLTLIAGQAADAQDLAERTELSHPRVIRALDGLLAKGLAELPAGPSGAVRATPPDLNLRLLGLQRMDEVRRAQAAIAQLSEQFQAHGPAGRGAESVEAVRGADAIARRFVMLQRAATQEICSLVKSPAVAVPATDNKGQREALQAGVRYRVVYERDLLAPGDPGIPLLLDEWAALGEEMRVAVDVPFKMVVFDRRQATIMRLELTEEPVLFIVHTRALVACLAWIFDRVWESALPVPAQVSALPDGPLAPDDRTLLALLLAGYTDQAIGSQLNVSIRTVQRRVQRLLVLAGVQSRVQLGWQAARREWI